VNRLLRFLLIFAFIVGIGMQRDASAPNRAPASAAPAYETKPPAGISPDCNEKPLNANALISLSQKSTTFDQINFLKKIPTGTLQTFTLIEKSESAQKTGISADWPGVIRMREDGKVVIRYTCDRQSPVYNTVEMMTFDDASATFHFTDIDFRKPPSQRVTVDSTNCLKCHNPKNSLVVDPRPNWNSYNRWPGTFGSFDDQIFDQATLDQMLNKDGTPKSDYFATLVGSLYRKEITIADLLHESEDFQSFQKNHRQDPCYQSLPWPTSAAPPYRNYPYSEVSTFHGQNYYARPNLKITDVFTHLLAKRLARKIKASPTYELLKYMSLFEIHRCSEEEDGTNPHGIKDQELALIRKILPEYTLPADGFDPEDSKSTWLYGVTAAANDWQPQDWTMFFGDHEETIYGAGIARPPGFAGGGGDVDLIELVTADLTFAALQKDPELARFAKLGRGVALQFGPQFSCIDDLGGILMMNEQEEDNFCDLLIPKEKTFLSQFTDEKIQRLRAHLASDRVARSKLPCYHCDESFSAGVFTQKLGDSIQDDPAMIARGEAVVKNTCMQCHSSDGAYDHLGFFKDETTLLERMTKNPDLPHQIQMRLNSTDSPMPPAGNMDQHLREDVEAYLLHLQSQSPGEGK
jgi:hypothetical protein